MLTLSCSHLSSETFEIFAVDNVYVPKIQGMSWTHLNLLVMALTVTFLDALASLKTMFKIN